MTLPTHLLQSQLALNKRLLTRMHNYERLLGECWQENWATYPRSAIQNTKKQIAKYTLLQKSIKLALKERAESAKYWRSVEDDITMHELLEEKKYYAQCASEDYVAECFAGSV